MGELNGIFSVLYVDILEKFYLMSLRGATRLARDKSCVRLVVNLFKRKKKINDEKINKQHGNFI